MNATTQHETFSSRFAFLMATVSGAVGLGNLWLFPYVAGQNGGGAFVFVYLSIILLIGVPLVMAELLIGRRAGQSPVASMRILCQQERAHQGWQIVGWLSIIGPPIALSFYTTVAGWSLAYIVTAVTGTFEGISGEAAGVAFDSLLASPERLLFWSFVNAVGVIYVVGRGVRSGIERATKIMMPTLFILLLLLMVYSNITGAAKQAWTFLFYPDFSKLTMNSVFIAIGQAFFSVTIGAGLLMTYGAYLSKEVALPKSAWMITLSDTAVALLAGLAIFPIVFAFNLDPAEGPGLTFVTLPIAFGQMPGGLIVGTLFFVLLFFAAFTSSLGMLEPTVCYLEERKGLKRMPMSILMGSAAWLVSIVGALSFNRLSDWRPLGGIEILADKTFFDVIVFLVSNIFLPVTGFLVAIFVGWIMTAESTREELGMREGGWFTVWRTLLRYVAPLGVGIVFVVTFLPD